MKQSVFFLIHQLNIGGAQKAAISALNAIDYDQNDVTVYVRKARLELLGQLNPRVSKVIINDDKNKYYRKPYAIYLQWIQKLYKWLGKDDSTVWERLRDYIADCQMRYEKKRFFSDGIRYDLAICYIQGYHAKFVANYIDAKRKVMFYHGSTDTLHKVHEDILGAFSTIYCVTQGAQQELQRFYPQFASKISYIENIVPFKDIREKANALVIPHKGSQIVFCSCGRFTTEKGFDLAIDTANILNRKGMSFVWYFVGDGPERKSLEERIESYGIQETIILTGMQENPYPYISVCDIYVQPSREESQGLTIIEAQILLRPVVSTRTVGGQTLVQDGVNGLLTDIDAESIAKAIGQLSMKSELRKQMESNLKMIDYKAKELEFKENWAKLLCG